MLCVPITTPEQAVQAAEYADILEVPSHIPLEPIREVTSLPIISSRNAEYIDIPFGQPIPDTSSKVIISYHNFKETPDNIEEIYNQMKSTGADIIKIAVMAHSAVDGLRILSLMKKADHPLIAIGMGVAGGFTRVLAPVFGGWGTFASVDENYTTAPGQLTISSLINDFHYRSLNPQTNVLGVIGDPVEHSSSPHIHNKWYREQNINAVYLPFRVPLGEEEEFIILAQKLGFHGLSVTMPIKQTVIPNTVCNTIRLSEGVIEGFNTDGIGAWKALERVVPDPKGKRVAIIGSGGAAKAIAEEGLKRGAEVIVLRRSEEFVSGCKCLSLTDLEVIDYDILIQCTPISERFIDPVCIRSGSVVMDIITRQMETVLLKDALEKGCKVVYGKEMLLKQAEVQHKIWWE